MYESDLADKKNTSTQYEELMRMNILIYTLYRGIYGYTTIAITRQVN